MSPVPTMPGLTAPALFQESWGMKLQELPQDAAPAATLPLPGYRGRVATSVKQFLQQASAGNVCGGKAADPLCAGQTLVQPAGSTLCATLAACPDAVQQLLAHLCSSHKAGQLSPKASGSGLQHTQHSSISKQVSRGFKRSPSPTPLVAHGRKRVPKRAALE